MKNLGWTFIEPDTGRLACGEEGVGRLADPQMILAAVLAALKGGKKDFVGVKFSSQPDQQENRSILCGLFPTILQAKWDIPSLKLLPSVVDW